MRFGCGVAPLVLLAVGCSATPAAPDVDGGVSTRELLATPQMLDIVPAMTSINLTMGIDQGAGEVTAQTRLGINAGRIRVRNDGRQVAVDELALALAPIDLPRAYFPAGVRLTDLQLRLVRPVLVLGGQWTPDGEDLTGGVLIGLDLDWAIEIAGHATPLATQHLAPLALDLAIGREGETLTLYADGHAAGVQWTWANIVWFGDVTLAMHART